MQTRRAEQQPSRRLLSARRRQPQSSRRLLSARRRQPQPSRRLLSARRRQPQPSRRLLSARRRQPQPSRRLLSARRRKPLPKLSATQLSSSWKVRTGFILNNHPVRLLSNLTGMFYCKHYIYNWSRNWNWFERKIIKNIFKMGGGG